MRRPRLLGRYRRDPWQVLIPALSLGLALVLALASFLSQVRG